MRFAAEVSDSGSVGRKGIVASRILRIVLKWLFLLALKRASICAAVGFWRRRGYSPSGAVRIIVIGIVYGASNMTVEFAEILRDLRVGLALGVFDPRVGSRVGDLDGSGG